MPAPIVHFEIGCQNSEKTSKFYGEVFGWTFSDYGPSKMVSNLGPSRDGTPPKSPGISGHISSLGHPPHQYVTVYALVDDPHATLAQIVKLGGRVIVPVTEVPGMGHFAWFADPEGNCVGLWKNAPCCGEFTPARRSRRSPPRENPRHQIARRAGSRPGS